MIWTALTSLSLGIHLFLLGAAIWCAGWVIQHFSSVLLPLALAMILAYILDPVVNFFERHKVPRTRAILMVMLLGAMIVVLLAATIVPRLFLEVQDLAEQVPAYSKTVHGEVGLWLAKTHWGARAKALWDSQVGQSLQGAITKALPSLSTWFLSQFHKAASYIWLLAGFALVPLYLFYFLHGKHHILRNWEEYVPMRESKYKDEVIFIVTAINDPLIVFFRGQVLVAMTVGGLLTIGYLIIGLNYAMLLGLMAGVLCIIPYMGITLSLIPALILSMIQFGLMGPVLVLTVAAIVQTAEGFYIGPKIIGDRVGLHPMAIIVSILVGTILLGGVVGGILAIPMTAALRVLMHRYVWRKQSV